MTINATPAAAIGDPSQPLPGADEIAALIDTIRRDADLRRPGQEPPQSAIDLIREHRLGAVRVPIELGGAGWSLRQLVDFLVELGTADPDVPHILRVHYEFVETQLAAHARTGDVGRWLPLVVSGQLFAGANTELTAKVVGTYEPSATLTSGPAGRRLDGRKFYTTGSAYADFLRVGATDTDTGEPVAVIIPARRTGVEHVDDWDGIGQRHTSSGTLVLDDVEVLDDEVQGGFSYTDATTDRNTLVHVTLHATAAGILQRIAQDAAQHLRERRRTYTFGAADAPGEDPQLLQIVGELESAAYVARAAVLQTADHLDAAARAKWDESSTAQSLQEDAALAAAKLKVGVEPLALKAAGDLFNIGGASAIREVHHLDRHWRNLRTLFSHHPTVYKARTVGDLAVNGTPLPRNGFY